MINMKKNYISTMTILMAIFVLFCYSSCGKDSENNDRKEEIINGINNNNNNSNDDSAKYEIVGSWKGGQISNVTGSLLDKEILLYIMHDGTCSYREKEKSPYHDLITGSGTWSYNSSTHKWKLSTGYSLLSGEYSLLGNQLICNQYFSDGSSRTIIFDKQ